MTTETGSGKNRLFNDSKLGLAVTGLGTVALDAVLSAVIENLSNVDMSGWHGWWTTVASAAVATALGAVTAYKARRDKARGQL
jgi:hypothetical protein